MGSKTSTPCAARQRPLGALLVVLAGCLPVSETFAPSAVFPHLAASSSLRQQCGVSRKTISSRALSARALRAAGADQEMRDEFSKLLGESGRDIGMKKIEPPKGSVEWMQQQQGTTAAVQTAPAMATAAMDAAPEVVAPAERPAYAVYDDGVGPQPAAKPMRPQGAAEAVPPALKSDIALTMFQTADQDGSGSLNFDEFEDLVHSVDPECSSELTQSLFGSIVCDDDSCQESISFLGLYRWLNKEAGVSGSVAQRLVRQNYENQARLLFREADTDGSGTIDAAELKVLGDVLGLKWTRKDAVEVCKELTQNDSGIINFDEFFDWFCSQTGSSRDKAGAFASQLRLMLRAHGIEQRQVLITGFPFKATADGAQRFFEQCGKINSVKMLPWAKTGKPSGRFVSEKSSSSAQKSRAKHNYTTKMSPTNSHDALRGLQVCG
jgi:Ca2+-binding EF-hand superfamily protein